MDAPPVNPSPGVELRVDLDRRIGTSGRGCRLDWPTAGPFGIEQQYFDGIRSPVERGAVYRGGNRFRVARDAIAGPYPASGLSSLSFRWMASSLSSKRLMPDPGRNSGPKSV